MVVQASYPELALSTAVVISAALSIFAWLRRPATGALPLSLLLLAAMEWSLCDLFEITSSKLSDKIFWCSAAYFGIVLIPLMWIIFVLYYTGREDWLTNRKLALLFLEPVITIALVWTNSAHGLIWSNIELDKSIQIPGFDPTYGIGFWVHAAYSYALVLLGILLLIQFLANSQSIYHGQATALLIGALLPLIGNAIYLTGISPFDPTSGAFCLSGIFFFWGAFRFHLLDILPRAQSALIESMKDGMIVIDSRNRVLNFNPAAQRIIGIPIEDAIGQPAFHVLSDQFGTFESYSDGDEERTEIEMSDGQAKGCYELRVSPFQDKHGRSLGRLTVLRDITKRKKAEEEVKKLNEVLESRVLERTAQLEAANEELQKEVRERERADLALLRARDELELRVRERTEELERKNTEMERFIYTVSHDLRSPLITVQGFAGFLRVDAKKGDVKKIENDINMIEGAVKKMDRLLTETLELSRIGRVVNPPEDVPFEAIVRESLMETSDKIKSNMVEVSVAECLPMVHVDRMRIVEVLVNLIENSIKYMGEQPHPRIEIGYRADGTEAVLFVRDNGMGIDPSQHEKIFELFYKVERKSEGTGAGLAIVKRIIEVHGGRVWVESKLGMGCTVCFTLPLLEYNQTSAAQPAAGVRGVQDAAA